MAKKIASKLKQHNFRDRMVLNKWLISLFGIDPLTTDKPFRKLVENIRDSNMEGVGTDNLHNFYHNLTSNLIWNDISTLSKDELLVYEQNIVRHTQAINGKRSRPIVWKYFQWLTLLFTEIYLSRYFRDKEALIASLNAFIDRFNAHYAGYAPIEYYTDEDCNKLCLQNATGSGKTLLMHVNILQYTHYATLHGKEHDLSRVILITTNEQLSEQHIGELQESGLRAQALSGQTGPLNRLETGLRRIDVMEITKLAEKDGVNQMAVRSLGDENLLLVDEAHRGMSGSDEGVWFRHRSALCAKGFTFEYSATFEQAVAASKNKKIENSYAKSILFDYSYRWFYEDGFGKDYSILNLPKSYDKVEQLYLTACLLKFYQQMRIYQERGTRLTEFNLEKPLWVFVGGTVTGKKDLNDVASDVAKILRFFAAVLADPQGTQANMAKLITGVGQDTGLMDEKSGDIFRNAFSYLADLQTQGESVASLHADLLQRVFNNKAGGKLTIAQIKGDSGEIVLYAGTSMEPFGLISVGDAKGLCEHVALLAEKHGTPISVEESEFTDAMFLSVKESSSPVNVLIGSKKFVEGWDCWRVSTMGLMHVGKKEGAQIIQLFGRGVRLKGHNWGLKRSSEINMPAPAYLRYLETLNVFGIAADFMKRFHEFLASEGLPGNQEKQHIFIPLTVTYDFGKKLLVPRPKNKRSINGELREYDFKKDGKVPSLADEVPDYIIKNRVVADWYPRIQTIESKGHGAVAGKTAISLQPEHLALLDVDALYFLLERHKRERSWHNFTISKEAITALLERADWYLLYLPTVCLSPQSFEDIRLIQNVVTELLKRYVDSYYNYRKREFLDPRMEYRELAANDALLPSETEYTITVDATETQVINSVMQIRDAIAAHRSDILQVGDLFACNFSGHLYQPLFFARNSSSIAITPVALNESEFTFVKGLKDWCENHKEDLQRNNQEIFILRNMSRGKGLGFFEAGGFYPDFIRWDIVGNQQYVSFIEPHGIMHEGITSPKVQFYKQIKDVEKRLGDSNIILNSFILSWSFFSDVSAWGVTRQDFEENNVLFMRDEPEAYLDKLQGKILSTLEVNQIRQMPVVPADVADPLKLSNVTEFAYLEIERATWAFVLIPHLIKHCPGLTDNMYLDMAALITAPDHLFKLRPTAKHTELRTAYNQCGILEQLTASNSMKRDIVRGLLNDNGMTINLHSRVCSLPANFRSYALPPSVVVLADNAYAAIVALYEARERNDTNYHEELEWYELEIA